MAAVIWPMLSSVLICRTGNNGGDDDDGDDDGDDDDGTDTQILSKYSLIKIQIAIFTKLLKN